MNRKLSKEIYLWYFRCTGLTCCSQNAHLEWLLKIYTSALLAVGLLLLYSFWVSKIFYGYWIYANIAGYTWQILYTGHHLWYMSMCLLTLLQCRGEREILSEFQKAQNTLGSLLREGTRESGRQAVDFICNYYWILEGLWLLVQTFVDYMDGALDREYLFFFLLPALAAGNVYLQAALLSRDLSRLLENLFQVLDLYLGNNKYYEPKNVQNPPPDHVPHRRQCALTMKWTYQKIHKISELASRLYGLRIFLVNVLCIFESTEIFYLVIVSMLEKGFDWIFVLKMAYTSLPNIFKFMYMHRLCDQLSQTVSKIRKI